MYKLFLSLLVSSGISLAAMVNGIAIIVNDEPITLYDIDKTMSVNNISKNEAVSYLIDKILYDQLVQENNITADVFDINDYTPFLVLCKYFLRLNLYFLKQKTPRYLRGVFR